MSSTRATDRPHAVLIPLSEVAAVPVEWLWRGRIARGKLTLLVGEPDVGKTFLMLDVVARISVGRAFPDGADVKADSAIFIGAEDGLSDTVKPRLELCGADLSRIHALTNIRTDDKERQFSLATDLALLEDEINKTGAALVVIDPLNSYLAHTNTYNDLAVRAVLDPLVKFAERLNIAVVGVMHLSKTKRAPALDRVLGSVAFSAVARSVLTVVKDTRDPDRRLLVQIKNNLSVRAPALAYRLDANGVEWETHCVIDDDVEAALHVRMPVRATSEHDVAFLRALLSAGPLLSNEVHEAAAAEGISRNRLFAAKDALGVLADKHGMGGPWRWSLPSSRSVHPSPVLEESAKSTAVRSNRRLDAQAGSSPTAGGFEVA